MKRSAHCRRTTLIRFLAISVSLLCFVSVHTAIAAKTETAHTPPPPVEVKPFSTFDPSFRYLDDGTASLSNNGSGKITVTGNTFATQNVDTVGVKMILQKWTGTAWIDLTANPGNHVRYDTDFVSASETYTVDKGYYYRVKSVHWAKEGNVTEQGEKTSGSYLIN